MNQPELIPHLFRTEYRKIVAVLCKLFGIQHIETAEDIVSDTFLLASEIWGLKGLPDNPTAWLYTVAKNKTKDYLKRNALFYRKIAGDLKYLQPRTIEMEVDFSPTNISDSNLAMLFVVCDPCNAAEAQISLALSILCGFGAEEIARAFLTSKEVIYKRLQRAKERLKAENISVTPPSGASIAERLPSVLTTLYLFFNEGYYSVSQNQPLRRDVCEEAIRLTQLLTAHDHCNQPSVNALLALMYFQSSRFNARTNDSGEAVLYHQQDSRMWDDALITQGHFYLQQAAQGNTLSKYHLEAAIAYWHTYQTDTSDKWENILQLYNHLLVIEYSPIAALNRTYALAKTEGKMVGISAAEKLNLSGNYLYHSLLGELYTDIDNGKALQHWQQALARVKSKADMALITEKILQCKKGLA